VAGADAAGVRRDLAAARLWAATRFPYLAQALFAQTVVLRPGTGAFSVDEGWRLYVDPAEIASMEVHEVGTKLVHHTGHLLRDHAARALEQAVDAGSSTHWLRAADAEINDDLLAAGLLQWDDPDLPAAFGAEPGRLAEEYFGLLMTPAEGDTPTEGDEGAGDPSDESGDDDTAAGQQPGDSPAVSGPGGSDEGAPGRGDPTLEHGDGGSHQEGHDCGSGAHGQQRPWDDPAAGDAPPGLSDVGAQLLRRAVADEINREAGRDPGSVPGGLARWAATVMRPRVDWRRALGAEVRRGLADASGRVDYSYRRPSRRPGNGVVLPSLRHPTPEIAAVVDTSGSMTDELLAQALAEIEGIARRAGLRSALRVLAVDTQVHAVSRARTGADVKLAGGGGTDMGRGIDAAERLRPRPQVVVVLTDGYTPWPSAPPPGIRVVVALLGADAPAASVPRWARTVVVDQL
jgi:predicted metal-dependent peptidase